jgi:hypothetical protein
MSDDEKISLEEIQQTLWRELREINEQMVDEGYPGYDAEDILGVTAQSFIRSFPELEPYLTALRSRVPEATVRAFLEDALTVTPVFRYIPRTRELKCPCSICLAPAKNTRNQKSKRNMTLVEPCGHCFHLNCILQWMDRKTTCPYCRREITGGLVLYRASASV